jgi:outer membrane protein OmpA-like peptidoglycan-associated protein
VFSPNNDKILDYAYFYPSLGSREKLSGLYLEIFDPSGREMLSKVPVQDKFSKTVKWDGEVDGKALPDAVYKARVSAVYENGVSTSNMADVEIDNTPPEMKAGIMPDPAMPAQNGPAVVPVTFALQAQDRNGVAGWRFVIWDSAKKIFFTEAGKGGPPERLTWAGKSTDNRDVTGDSDFYYSLVTTDNAGNKGMTKPQPLKVYAADIRLEFSSDTLFDLGQANVKISAYAALKAMKKTIDKYPGSRITVTGYTDDTQPQGIKYNNNTELSKDRAEAVKYFMINMIGYDEHRIAAAGYGELYPAGDNTTEEGRRQNRRVEISVYK